MWPCLSYHELWCLANEPCHWPHLSEAGLCWAGVNIIMMGADKTIITHHCQLLMGTVWHEAGSQSQPGNWSFWPIRGRQLPDITWHICTCCEEILMSRGVTTGLCFHCNPYLSLIFQQKPNPKYPTDITISRLSAFLNTFAMRCLWAALCLLYHDDHLLIQGSPPMSGASRPGLSRASSPGPSLVRDNI